MEHIKKDFTTITLVMMPIAIVINIVLGQLVQPVLKLPFYLDSIGTVLVAVLAGPWAGALTGLLTNLIWGLSGLYPQITPFALVAAVIGMMAGLFAESGWFRTWWKVLVAGLITGVVAAALSAPIAAYVFGGVTASGADFLVAFFRALGYDQLNANFFQGLVSDPVDKLASFLVVWLILLALPARLLINFPRGANVRSAMPTTAALAPAGSAAAIAQAKAGTKPLGSTRKAAAAAATTAKGGTAKPAAKGGTAKSTAKGGKATGTAAKTTGKSKPASKGGTARKPASRSRSRSGGR